MPNPITASAPRCRPDDGGSKAEAEFRFHALRSTKCPSLQRKPLEALSLSPVRHAVHRKAGLDIGGECIYLDSLAIRGGADGLAAAGRQEPL